MTRLRAVVVLASATFLVLTLTTLAFADSQIRMVRLSQVDGTVRIDRHTGNGFEKAIPNMPVTQGVRLQTGSNGRAEIEMEDGTYHPRRPGNNHVVSRTGAARFRYASEHGAVDARHRLLQR